jgi:tRNA(Ile2) C34 agmatinyltransferase TiaS
MGNKSEPKLRECPFCGGEAVFDGCNFYWVRCKKCKAETRGVITKVIASNLWNKRVGDERMVGDGR